MPGVRQSRRAFLTATAAVGAGTASIGRASAASGDGSVCERKQSSTRGFNVLRGHPQEFEVYVVDSGIDGPTAFVIGGIHGDEEAGIIAANTVVDWEPEAGRIVIVPEANPVAIERNSRYNETGNLNRQFVSGQQPTTMLARAIWKVVQAADPDLVIALHESNGIYQGTPSGVGQTIFHSPTDIAHDTARFAVRRVNRLIDSERLEFKSGYISDPSHAPSGLLTEKTTYDEGTPSLLVETYEDVSLEKRVRWQLTSVRAALDYWDLYS